MHLSRAISLLEAGDRLAISHPDPMKAAQLPKYFLVEHGGGAHSRPVPQAPAAADPGRGWPLRREPVVCPGAGAGKDRAQAAPAGVVI